jgi:flavin reductase (DIM6/NTAB) family NADH-FMN oxidoreductase RutF
MDRVAVDPFENLEEVFARIRKPGLLLTTGNIGNPMTIGWGTIGVVWSKPVFTVLVRPSRYSFEMLKEVGDFSVSVPASGDKETAKAVAWCGSHSGREGDKYEAVGLTKEPGITIDVPYVAECPRHFECRRIHSNHVLDGELDHEIRSRYYPEGDLHQIWWGEILGAWRIQ